MQGGSTWMDRNRVDRRFGNEPVAEGGCAPARGTRRHVPVEQGVGVHGPRAGMDFFNEFPVTLSDLTMSSSPSLQDLGEFGLVARLKELLPADTGANLVVGIGDDAAALRLPGGLVQVITTDLLTADVHFLADRTPPESLGYKAIAVSVSDILAMNALPGLATVAVALPASTAVDEVEAIYGGIARAARDFDVRIAGGDTTAAHALTLSVTVLGLVKEKDLVLRSGAREGDVIAVTCDLGAAYAGLQVLLRNAPPERFPGVLQRLEWPSPPIDVVRDWAEREIRPSALIDISDGPVAETIHLCRQSRCGARLRMRDLPIAPETRAVADYLGDDPVEYALYGGDEYGLLFAIAEEEYRRMDPSRFHVIGCMTAEDSGIVLEADGGDVSVDADRCFSHFAAEGA